MSPEVHMGIEIGFGLVVALIGIVYRNDQKALDAYKLQEQARVASLETQNAAQEREIATLKANHANHADGMVEVRDTLRELRDLIQQLMLRMGYRQTPYTAGEGGRKT